MKPQWQEPLYGRADCCAEVVIFVGSECSSLKVVAVFITYASVNYFIVVLMLLPKMDLAIVIGGDVKSVRS